MMRWTKIVLLGLACFACFLAAFLTVAHYFGGEGFHRGGTARYHTATLLAFGDVNLGRMVGQKILNGEMDFPFENMALGPDRADIVFANLESQLSDQDGETQDPDHNMIFTGPPTGAMSLVSFGFTHVSTANNHAFDYGKDALLETLERLDEENIAHVGTARSADELYQPLAFETAGIRFALFAVTDLMNFTKGWHEYVAVTDTGKLFPAVRAAASSVDVVLLSFHGGEEYKEAPTQRVKEFAELCALQGVKVFLGHHPHVPYGVEEFHGSYLFHSLGNFVFYQPQSYWTQRSFAAEIQFEKKDSCTVISAVSLVPLRAGYQPAVLTDSTEVSNLQKRLQALSNVPLTLKTKGTIH